MDNEYGQAIDIENVQHNLIAWMNFIFEKYKTANSLLGYLIANDYDGLLIMSSEEWDSNIFQHNFSVGIRLEERDGHMYIEGKENT